jgi:hypothetical protein
MQRPSIPWFWILLPVLFLVLPGPARRLLLDLLGGLTLTLLLLPLLVGGLAVLGWQVLRRRLRTCEACGFSSLGSPVCPACGTPFPEGAFPGDRTTSRAAPGIWKGRTDRDLDARNVTINVEAVDVGGGVAPPLATPPPPGSTGSSAAADQSPPPGS